MNALMLLLITAPSRKVTAPCAITSAVDFPVHVKVASKRSARMKSPVTILTNVLSTSHAVIMLSVLTQSDPLFAPVTMDITKIISQESLKYCP